MRVGDVMTRSVVSVQPNTSVLEASELMLKHNISGLPVVDQTGRVVGLVTERDFLRPTGRSTDYKRPRWLEVLIGKASLGQKDGHKRAIADVMTASPLTVTEETPLEEAVGLMEERQIHRLPVVGDGGLVGIVARADLLRALVRSIRRVTEASRKDENNLRRMTELERGFWLSRSRQS